MEDETVLEIYKKLMPIIEDVAIGSPTQDKWLQVFFGASLMKCLEFNLISFTETNTNSPYFSSSGLRGICEDLVTLKYFKEIIEPQDAQRILWAWSMKQMTEGTEKQSLFFKINRPQQPVIPYSEWFQKTLKSSKAELRVYRSKYGWARNLPKVIEMADACSMRALYDYVYHATSKSVHFSPHLFMRMGWGEMESAEPSFQFSTKNFAQYYLEFNQFYGTFLFIKFCETFGCDLNISDKLENSLSKLRDYLKGNPRWPELVTYEEMNLRPPNFHAIHLWMTFLEGSSPQDLCEIIQIVLTESNNEKINKMSAEEKRDAINKIFSGQSSDKVAAMPENKLDQILHGMRKELLVDIKSDIQAEDVAKFLSSIPTEDLVRYIEKIPVKETLGDLSEDEHNT